MKNEITIRIDRQRVNRLIKSVIVLAIILSVVYCITAFGVRPY